MCGVRLSKDETYSVQICMCMHDHGSYGKNKEGVEGQHIFQPEAKYDDTAPVKKGYISPSCGFCGNSCNAEFAACLRTHSQTRARQQTDKQYPRL